VGLSIAKAMAISLNKPLVAVNHLEGHALSPKIIHKISFPYLLLLISGGHTQFLEVSGVGKYKRLGTTIDDAVGEAFDKTAKLIGIKFPGGPQIESFAEKGDKNYFKLPKPILNKGGCNLSFAGLKTAVLKISKNINSKKDKYNLAASFQNTIENILYEKSKIAMSMFKENNKKVNSAFVIAGGVASNKKIRNTLKNLSIKKGFKPIFPPINLCSDNAAMIAWAGIEKFKLNLTDKLNFPARARWPLDENAPFMKGAGVKF
jgi:N6-L-threonylcarbamoyladenine synthase